MALYRLEMQNVSRSDGVSSVAKAAYRHRSVMIDHRTGEIHGEKSLDRDDLVYAEILRPENTPACLHVPSEVLWNIVEKKETRSNSRTAKEFKITLPTELSNEQNIALMKDFLLNHFVDKGIICDFVLHNDKDNKNPHAHVMITTREITPNGFGKKVREWDTEETLHKWRKDWAKVQNQHLKNAGLKSRVSHRTLEEQKNIMIDLAKKAEDAKDFDKSILYLAKAIELDRPPMQNLSRKKWRSKEGQEQRKRDQAIRDRAKQDARAVRLLRGVAVVDVASFVVHPLEKKEHSKNNDFSVKNSWWRSTVNFIKNIKAKFSTKKDIKPGHEKEPDLMIDPVTGLPITKQKWDEMAERANVRTPQAAISYQVKQSHADSEKTAQNALQDVLDVSEGKSVKVKSVPVPGSRRRRVIEEDSSDKG
ncbi:TPA: MobA/MobL family protein [Klebsiella pneumoniae]|nr:MobA/MobL family protein [Klebsiella pneumoniae]